MLLLELLLQRPQLVRKLLQLVQKLTQLVSRLMQIVKLSLQPWLALLLRQMRLETLLIM
jgi:hypothetical protein